jgi:DNA-binding MarR family transcriptional regulator
MEPTQALQAMRCGAPDPRRNERLVLRALIRAANAGQPCPKADDLQELLGCYSNSTPTEVIRRLEKRGLIKVERYQRGRRVTIVSTGKMTRACVNTAPHWRDRPRDVPTPSAVSLQQRRPDTAAQIFAEARKLGKAPQEFLADLVWVGWRETRREAI